MKNEQDIIAISLDNKGKEEILASEKTNLNPRRVWSVLVENLKQSGFKTLFSLCGELRNVEFEGNTLLVTLDDKVSYDILCSKNNFERVEEFLKKIEARLDLKFVLKKKNEDIEKNIEKLKRLFDNNLFVK